MQGHLKESEILRLADAVSFPFLFYSGCLQRVIPGAKSYELWLHSNIFISGSFGLAVIHCECGTTNEKQNPTNCLSRLKSGP